MQLWTGKPFFVSLWNKSLIQQHMANTQTNLPDYATIARQAYEWLKKRRAKGEISTFEVLMKMYGYKNGTEAFEKMGELFLFRVDDHLMDIIEQENEYVADFSAYEDQYVGLPYNIPFVFRKK